VLRGLFGYDGAAKMIMIVVIDVDVNGRHVTVFALES
jgi:hypothetical protein